MKKIIFISTIVVLVLTFLSCSKKQEQEKAGGQEMLKSKIETHVSECIFYNVEKKYSLEIKDETSGKSTSRIVIYDDVANNYVDPTRKIFYDSNNDGQMDSVKVYYYKWPENLGPNVRAHCISSEVLKKNQKTQIEYDDFMTIKDLLNGWVTEYQSGEHQNETEKVFVDRFEDGYAVNNHDYLWIVKYRKDNQFISKVSIEN